VAGKEAPRDVPRSSPCLDSLVPVVRVVGVIAKDGAGGREVVLEVGAEEVGEGGAVGEREEGQRGVLSISALVQFNKLVSRVRSP
jgi:hypothetical protein